MPAQLRRNVAGEGFVVHFTVNRSGDEKIICEILHRRDDGSRFPFNPANFSPLAKRSEKPLFLFDVEGGDWVNYFTREAAEIFDRHAGDVLVMLGYKRPLLSLAPEYHASEVRLRMSWGHTRCDFSARRKLG